MHLHSHILVNYLLITIICFLRNDLQYFHTKEKTWYRVCKLLFATFHQACNSRETQQEKGIVVCLDNMVSSFEYDCIEECYNVKEDVYTENHA